MTDVVDLSARGRGRVPSCEYTAPGSTTEAIDCWEPAVVRAVNDRGVTVALFCDAHGFPPPHLTVERIEGEDA